MEVTLEQVLAAREKRAFRQYQLNRDWKAPIVSFCMNIPGPVKDSPLIRRGFGAGCAALDHRLPREKVKYRKIFPAATGWEAAYVVDMDAMALKAITTAIEDQHGIGRLFDMDVLDVGLNKLDRKAVSGHSRDCIVCGAPGRGCASRRVHSVDQLQTAVNDLLTGYFVREDARHIGALALQSLLEEVCTTPKPGLVDCCNSGSHTDMDLFTFTASAAALAPYLTQCAEIGIHTASLPPQTTFSRLREAGLQAEQAMLSATGGVNTHKGAIFTMGILCGAAGRLWTPEGGWEEGAIFQEAASMTREAMEADFRKANGATAGQQIFAASGIRGIRGEAAQGFPSVKYTGLPVYRQSRRQGLSQNDAGVMTLLHLIANVEDTCLIHRGGLEKARTARQKAAALAAKPLELDLVEQLDQWFMKENLSAGGCADLLAAVYFLEKLCKPEE